MQELEASELQPIAGGLSVVAAIAWWLVHAAARAIGDMGQGSPI